MPMRADSSVDCETPDDLPTVLSIGILTYLSADIAHHVLGHGSACAIMSGKILSISSVLVKCTITGAQVDVPGPLANLIVGLASWIVLRRVRKGALLRLALLEVAGFNLFWFAGQLIFSAATLTDDWQQLLLALKPTTVWRLMFIAVGVAGYAITFRGLSHASGGFDPFRLRRLLLIGWIGAGVVAGITSLRDPDGLHALIHHALPQAFLLPFGLLFLRAVPSARPAVPIVRQRWLIVAACTAAVTSVVVLGPGMRLP